MQQTLEIPITDDLLTLLDRKATRQGLNRDAYVHSVLTRDLRGYTEIDELLAPFRAQVAASGMTDEELDHLFEDARQEVWLANISGSAK